MKNYLTHRGILTVALVCFIAGGGFIGSIWILCKSQQDTQKHYILENYKNGNIKPMKGGVIIQYDKDTFAIINDNVYNVDK